MRVAAIDCGTNSLRLLVADLAADGSGLTDVDRRMRIVRLGQGVDATGRIAPEAMARTLDTVGEYAGICRELGVEAMRFVATSATRDAANAGDFVAGVRELLGTEPEVVPGAEEAELSFTGATNGLTHGEGGPYLVVDLGGGSTELVLGTAHVDAALSLDVGSVRMTERHLHDDPPTPAQVAAAAADVDAHLDRAAAVVPLARVRTLVGVAGTITALTAIMLELPEYDSSRVHGAVFTVEEALAGCHRLLAMGRDERAALPSLHPGRVDVIGAGALIWSRVIERVVAASGVTHVTTSEHDILDGIALSLAR